MSVFRTPLTVLSLALLALGYGASQWAFFYGSAAEYAKKVDTPPVKWLALVLLALAIVMAFIPDREEPKDEP